MAFEAFAELPAAQIVVPAEINVDVSASTHKAIYTSISTLFFVVSSSLIDFDLT